MTNSMRQASILAFLLIALGMGVFVTKAVRHGFPLTPGVTTTVWDFEIYLEFAGQNRATRLEVFIPTSDAERNVSGEQFYNGPFGLSLTRDDDTRNRRAIWTYRYPEGRKVLRYTAQTIGETPDDPIPSSLGRADRDARPFEGDMVRQQAFIVWTSTLRRRSADPLSQAALTIQEIFNPEGSDEIEVLLPDLPRPLAQLELARITLESQGVAARVVNGVFLSEGRRRADLRSWLEYRAGGEDVRYFPGGEPARFFTLWYGTDDFVDSRGASELDVQIALQGNRSSAEQVALGPNGDDSFAVRYFGFDGLPLTTQLVYKVLVTIPVGIVLLVFLRQFIGIQTLGTFMPVLIGIAFRETALLNGLLLFTILIAIGLAARMYLERLQLLLVPRLAVVLIFIVIAMAGITILMTGANQAIGLSISLFPMVILTMTIERMSIVWEEYSAGEAVRQAVGSLMVASLAYLAMTHPQVEYLMYNFPELLFVLMGICLLMGRYTGLRLTEIWRFRELARR